MDLVKKNYEEANTADLLANTADLLANTANSFPYFPFFAVFFFVIAVVIFLVKNYGKKSNRIKNFANIKEINNEEQINRYSEYSDNFKVPAGTPVSDSLNIDRINKKKVEGGRTVVKRNLDITKNIMNLKAFLKERSVPVYIAVAVVAIGVIFLANNYDKIGLAYNNIKATFENEPNKIQKVGNFEEINNEEQIDRDSEYSDNFKVPAGTPVSDCLNIKRTNNKKVEGGKTVVKRDIDLTVKV
ncbi:unnamed protein product [Diamesa tonsa]